MMKLGETRTYLQGRDTGAEREPRLRQVQKHRVRHAVQAKAGPARVRVRDGHEMAQAVRGELLPAGYR